MSSVPKLFEPLKVGNLQLKHRVVLAPLTRFKSTKAGHVPIVPLMKEYYGQRASQPGTLLITGGTFIAATAGGYHNIPGIWSSEQIRAWKEESFIYLQLWATGRAGMPDVLASENLPFVGPSPIPMPSSEPDPVIPKELNIEEIEEYIQLYVQAARNAVNDAGFDGVELHCANGYLVDQFLQDTANHRTDKYGGSIENRSRFALEIIDALCDAVGEERVGFRVSVWSTFQGMRMTDPIPQFSHFVSTVKTRHPSLAYLHTVEPRIAGDREAALNGSHSHDSNNFLKEIWKPKQMIVAGGFKRENALQIAQDTGCLVAFGRDFLSNPDLPLRLMREIPLNHYDRKTFYVAGDTDGAEKGYIDYPFAVAQGKT